MLSPTSATPTRSTADLGDIVTNQPPHEAVVENDSTASHSGCPDLMTLRVSPPKRFLGLKHLLSKPRTVTPSPVQTPRASTLRPSTNLTKPVIPHKHICSPSSRATQFPGRVSQPQLPLRNPGPYQVPPLWNPAYYVPGIPFQQLPTPSQPPPHPKPRAAPPPRPLAASPLPTPNPLQLQPTQRNPAHSQRSSPLPEKTTWVSTEQTKQLVLVGCTYLQPAPSPASIADLSRIISTAHALPHPSKLLLGVYNLPEISCSSTIGPAPYTALLAQLGVEGWSQIVRSPTRGLHTLDLIFSNDGHLATAAVGPSFPGSDTCVVSTNVVSYGQAAPLSPSMFHLLSPDILRAFSSTLASPDSGALLQQVESSDIIIVADDLNAQLHAVLRFFYIFAARLSSMSDCSCQREDQIESPWANSDCNVVVTGASRGFGRALCLKLTEALSKEPGAARSINMLLMARDLEALNRTKEQVVMSKAPKSPTTINVLISRPGLDMVNISEQAARAALQPLFDLNPVDQLEKVAQWNLLVHNAATIGSTVIRADERTSVASLEDYYRANLLAPMIITSLFLNYFAPFGSVHPPVIVLNVSSLFAMQPCSLMSDYCVGKAARHMYLKSLSTDRPTVAVFNYCPGPLDTDMFNEMLVGHADPERRAWAENLKKSGGLLMPEESARVCMSWLRRCHYNFSRDGDGVKLRPESIVCPIHQKQYMDVWTGTNLDYYDALAIEQALIKQPA
ncbi:hypothetical protein T265_05841 [Opisthorchis viverrini]|uniref:Sepiapterin reductase n=1 Tax=Opisthorchis viverrini TaxID=6198 RepID=A0A074ZI63_OPIVI|nr:hypothetical protein T265_05841 [Opisthorchis viverrini]KER27008.1 hypothetical protein T265_05841 [Opisthorchis viverrini]